MNKAQTIVNRKLVTRDKDDLDFWAVKSLTDVGVQYDVYFKGTGGSCTCRGFKYRGTCCHLDAVRMLVDSQKGERVPEGEILL